MRIQIQIIAALLFGFGILGVGFVNCSRPGGVDSTRDSSSSVGNDLVNARKQIDGLGAANPLSLDYTPISIVDLNGTLYAAGVFASPNGPSASVLAFNGNFASPAWTVVDGSPNGINFKQSGGNSFASDVAASTFGGKLYVAWIENDALPDSKVLVAVFNNNNGAPAWKFVVNTATGMNRTAGSAASDPTLLSVDSKLYASWIEAGKVRVAVYSGDDNSPVWTLVDGQSAGGLNKVSSRSAYSPKLVAVGTKIFAVWLEYNSSNLQVRVAVYNGDDSAPTWKFVDGGGANGINHDPANDANGVTATALNGTLFLAWSEWNSGLGHQIRVVSYNGDDASPAWNSVDGNGANGVNVDSSLPATDPFLTAFSSRLYLSWTELNPKSLSIQRMATYDPSINPSIWNHLDYGGDGLNINPDRNSFGTCLAVSNSKLFSFWLEEDLNYQLQSRAAVWK